MCPFQAVREKTQGNQRLERTGPFLVVPEGSQEAWIGSSFCAAVFQRSRIRRRNRGFGEGKAKDCAFPLARDGDCGITGLAGLGVIACHNLDVDPSFLGAEIGSQFCHSLNRRTSLVNIGVHSIICQICGLPLIFGFWIKSGRGNVPLLQLHRFEFGEDVADENVCLDPQRDAFVVIR